MEQQKIEGLDKVEGSHIKLKGYLMMKGRPCRCTKYSTAKPGKHGHVKCNITGADLLKADKKYQHMCPGHEMIEIPIVKTYDLEVSDVDLKEGNLTFMTEDAEEVVMSYKGDDELHKEIADKWAEIEASGADNKVIVASIIQATCGENGKYTWEEKIDKVNVRTEDD
mmetsp:Transcript_13707/g.33531  ORF Transcript_13707/g.33531 Transcript_13707/m.33531 type:complete len:167 (-) Transcript_13707:428-928(-)|eukprot:CAMPEP_0114497526 /NCGR_PEP_ID=MMETSP0109-20121206/6380_1 /TAXON_ID=29199 /ORGANISM="Chlorarachnion reptans, Strain CCCM449" /LENGTH=166 /DNA_ID=CAMNT_0001674931 /DNA_START=178 /DNA_END=678 /DNA_ORIENTATION=+